MKVQGYMLTIHCLLPGENSMKTDAENAQFANGIQRVPGAEPQRCRLILLRYFIDFYALFL
jgi:hypothetical protein